MLLVKSFGGIVLGFDHDEGSSDLVGLADATGQRVGQENPAKSGKGHVARRVESDVETVEERLGSLVDFAFVLIPDLDGQIAVVVAQQPYSDVGVGEVGEVGDPAGANDDSLVIAHNLRPDTERLFQPSSEFLD